MIWGISILTLLVVAAVLLFVMAIYRINRAQRILRGIGALLDSMKTESDEINRQINEAQHILQEIGETLDNARNGLEASESEYAEG